MRNIQIILLIILIGFLVWKGIYPSFTTIDSDFPNYYTAAKLFVEGKDLSQIYNDDWFQEQIHSYDIIQQGKFSPFPPVTVLLMTPIAAMSPLNALRVWSGINLIMLCCMVLLLSKIAGKNLRWSALLIFSSGLALSNNFRLGQWYIALSLLLMLSYYAYRQSCHGLSGMTLAIGCIVKYFPIIYIPLFVIRREWKLLFICCLTVISICILTLIILGKGVHEQFLSNVFINHLSGNIQDPFSPAFQSWNSLLRRLFIYDEFYNQQPLFSSTAVFYAFQYAIMTAVITATIVACRRAEHIHGTQSFQMQFALVGVAGLLLLPAGATYHFLLLILPVGILLSMQNSQWSINHKILLALYVSLGFIPYSMFKQFDGSGILTVLAYPRLWIITTIYILSLTIVWKAPAAMHPSTHNL